MAYRVYILCVCRCQHACPLDLSTFDDVHGTHVCTCTLQYTYLSPSPPPSLHNTTHFTTQNKRSRTYETLGECPYLTAQMGRAIIEGIQGPDPRFPDVRRWDSELSLIVRVYVYVLCALTSPSSPFPPTHTAAARGRHHETFHWIWRISYRVSSRFISASHASIPHARQHNRNCNRTGCRPTTFHNTTRTHTPTHTDTHTGTIAPPWRRRTARSATITSPPFGRRCGPGSRPP